LIALNQLLAFEKAATEKVAAFFAFRPASSPKTCKETSAMSNAAYSFDALMDITARPKTVFVRGEGSWLWDDAGKRYLDFIQGWAVNCLGHSPPAVAEAIAAQAKT